MKAMLVFVGELLLAIACLMGMGFWYLIIP